MSAVAYSQPNGVAARPPPGRVDRPREATVVAPGKAVGPSVAGEHPAQIVQGDVAAHVDVVGRVLGGEAAAE